MDNLIELVTNGIYIGLAVVGGASLVVQGLAKIAAVTPSTKDDAIVGKVEVVLSVLVKVLDKLALNLPADKARKG